MALRIYASGNMVAIENTKTGVIKKRAKNLIAYNIDSSASPVLYNLYIKDPFGAIEEGLNIDGFQKENGAMGAIPFGVLMDAVARLKPDYESLVSEEEVEAFAGRYATPWDIVAREIGALYLRKAAADIRSNLGYTVPCGTVAVQDMMPALSAVREQDAKHLEWRADQEEKL